MSGSKSRQIIKEFAKREKQKELDALKPRFSIEEYCFDKQIAFIRDPAKFKTAVCSRRAGKTVSCAADLMDTALSTPEVNVAYITLTRGTARRIIWKDLVRIVEKFSIASKIDNKELSITLRNGSTIYLGGADDESEIEKFRGMHFKKVYIDEAQSFRSYIESLVDEIIIPTLYDYDGSLCIIGTPGPVCAGYFHKVSISPGFSHHHWTLYDNPWIKIKSGKAPEDIISAELVRRGVDETDPKHKRENCGLWVSDSNSLVMHFNKTKNLCAELPKGKMEYIVGVDIGWEDADAIAVIGYSYEDKNVYLVEEKITTKQTITGLAEQLLDVRARYNPVRMVMDAGALGKKIQEEIHQRHGIYIQAAEKSRKNEFITLLNDDLRMGRFKTLAGSRFEEDSFLMQWDFTDPAHPRISNIFHSDIADAVLYAWRESKHYLYSPIDPPPRPGTNEFMDALEAKEAQDLQDKASPVFDLIPTDDDMQYIIGDIYEDDL